MPLLVCSGGAPWPTSKQDEVHISEYSCVCLLLVPGDGGPPVPLGFHPLAVSPFLRSILLDGNIREIFSMKLCCR